MNGDEKRGLVGAGDRHPFAERNEGVVVAGEHDPIAPVLLEPVAQFQRHREHDRLLLLAAGGNRAGVEAAMAGIDHDHRLAVARRGDIAQRSRIDRYRRDDAGVALQRGSLDETLTVAFDQIDHQTGRLLVLLGEHIGLVDGDRPLGVDDDPGLARREQAVAESGDQSAPFPARGGGQIEHHLGKIHDHPIRIAEDEGAQIELAGEVEDQAGALVVAGEPRVEGDDARGAGQGGRRGQRRGQRRAALGKRGSGPAEQQSGKGRTQYEPRNPTHVPTLRRQTPPR